VPGSSPRRGFPAAWGSGFFFLAGKKISRGCKLPLPAKQREINSLITPPSFFLLLRASHPALFLVVLESDRLLPGVGRMGRDLRRKRLTQQGLGNRRREKKNMHRVHSTERGNWPIRSFPLGRVRGGGMGTMGQGPVPKFFKLPKDRACPAGRKTKHLGISGLVKNPTGGVGGGRASLRAKL